jgi:hypothetical protein
MYKRSLKQIEESLLATLNEIRPGGGFEKEYPQKDTGGGGGGVSPFGSSRVTTPQVWSRGGEPIAPPASKPAPNVWRKGEAPPKPPEPAIGSQVGKTPKKKLDEPVDLAKEFEKTKPAAKKETT